MVFCLGEGYKGLKRFVEKGFMDMLSICHRALFCVFVLRLGVAFFKRGAPLPLSIGSYH